MSNADELADLFTNRLHEAVNHNLGEKVKELITEKDPTIDWSKVTIVANVKDSQFYMESDDPLIEEKIQAAYLLVKADQQSNSTTEKS